MRFLCNMYKSNDYKLIDMRKHCFLINIKGNNIITAATKSHAARTSINFAFNLLYIVPLRLVKVNQMYFFYLIL